MHVKNVNIKFVRCIIYSIAFGFLFNVLAAHASADAPFSGRPMFWQPGNGSDRQNDQTFNGMFVARLFETFATPTGDECLRQAGSGRISVSTYDSGSLRTSLPSTAACNMFSQGIRPLAGGNQTQIISIPASYILSVKHAIEAFNGARLFSRNDRDLRKYDVETYQKNGKLYVSLLPPPYSSPGTLGCPRLGLLAVTYIVDPVSTLVIGGNMAC